MAWPFQLATSLPQQRLPPCWAISTAAEKVLQQSRSFSTQHRAWLSFNLDCCIEFMQKSTVVLNKAGRNWVPYAQGKVGALLWVLCSWTWSGEDYKIKAVGNWLDFHSPLPTMGSMERSNVRIKGRSSLDLHLSCIYIMRMERCWNTQHLEEAGMRARGIMPLEETWRCFNCKWRQEHKIL